MIDKMLDLEVDTVLNRIKNNDRFRPWFIGEYGRTFSKGFFKFENTLDRYVVMDAMKN